MALTAALPLRWPWTVRVDRRAFWSRFVMVAALVVALVVGQLVVAKGAAAVPSAGVFILVAVAYVYTLARLDDMDDKTALLRWYTLACLLSSAATLIVLSSALGFIVSVCTMLFLGACMPLRWHQRVTLPLVAANVWLLQVVSVTPPTLVQALSDGIGLLVMAVFGFTLRRATRLGQDLARANTELQTHARQAEELATLRERARLARELHDTLGHALTTITVQLEAAERQLERNPAKALTLLERSRDLSRAATMELRASLAGLRDDRAGLTTELKALSTSGWRDETRIDVTAAELSLSPQQEHALARVAREALENIRRHARATHVQVDLTVRDHAVVLRVADDGVGFDPAAIPPGHYGLSGMRERLTLLGGTLDVRSQQGAGATVTATLPLRAPTPTEVLPI